MNTSFNDRRRGSQPVDDSTTEHSVSTLSKADQMAWEAPELRSVFTPEGQQEKWAHPCPDWCLGEGYQGHDLDRLTVRAREHGGMPLRVRTDAARGYYAEEETSAGRVVEGVQAACIEAMLVAGSRTLVPTIRLTALWGDDEGGEKKFSHAPLYFDEVRELIAVLQHLLKVGQES